MWQGGTDWFHRWKLTNAELNSNTDAGIVHKSHWRDQRNKGVIWKRLFCVESWAVEFRTLYLIIVGEAIWNFKSTPWRRQPSLLYTFDKTLIV